jgi:hypothetical protein
MKLTCDNKCVWALISIKRTVAGTIVKDLWVDFFGIERQWDPSHSLQWTLYQVLFSSQIYSVDSPNLASDPGTIPRSESGPWAWEGPDSSPSTLAQVRSRRTQAWSATAQAA